MDEAESDEVETESTIDWGRRLVDDAADTPYDALAFLSRPTLGVRRGPPQGASPGEMILPTDAFETEIQLMRFGRDSLDEMRVESAENLGELVQAPDRLCWIDVRGFGSQRVLEAIGKQLEIHPLALADVVHVPQRPKAEPYEDRLLVILQMAHVSEDGEIQIEQVSLVLGPNWVVSFQEEPGDVFDPIRQRIRSGSPRIRSLGPDYLLYSLLDAVVDGYFQVVERLGAVVEALEEDVVTSSKFASLARLHSVRSTLLMLHRIQWRQRDAINAMLRGEADMLISDAVLPYLRDAHDHAFQTLDAIETYREMVGGLMDLFLSRSSHRMNEVMKTLTIVSTIFIPLTFLAGVYGMNFKWMPELGWRLGYPTFWISIVVIGVGLLFWFRRRGWLGDLPDKEPSDGPSEGGG